MASRNTENDFKKSLSYGFSEGGHNYQISYSSNAAKNSSPVIYFTVRGDWYVLKQFEDQRDRGVEVFRDSSFFPQRGVFIYALGLKSQLPLFKNYLSGHLTDRAYHLQTVYPGSLLSPGLSGFVKNCCLNFHSSCIYQTRNTTGLTSVCLISPTVKEETTGFLIYPSGRVVYGSPLYEGGIEESQVQEVLDVLRGEELSDLDSLTLDQILENKKKLRGWELYHIDLLEREVRAF